MTERIPMLRRLLPLTAGLALSASLLACGDPTEPGGDGVFEAQVSGDISLELQGRSMFGVFPGEGFGLSLQPDGASHLLAIARRTEARPAVGTYAMASPDNTGAYYGILIAQGTAGPITFASYEGELVVTASSATRLEGTFSFAARDYMGPNQMGSQEVWVTGSFSAPCSRDARCD
jgi:hypothetical protein